MAPIDPKRLQIMNRVKDVLLAISAGSDFFFDPVDVFDVDVLEIECKGYPSYSVHADSGGQITEESDNLYEETFYLNIKGLVKDVDNPRSALERALRDVRKAVNDDTKSGVDGSLAKIAVSVEFTEAPTTDNGFFSGQGFAYFDQRVRVIYLLDLGE